MKIKITTKRNLRNKNTTDISNFCKNDGGKIYEYRCPAIKTIKDNRQKVIPNNKIIHRNISGLESSLGKL